MQTTNKKAARKTQAEWQALIDHWKTSGETAQVYCQRLDINLATFLYWRGIFSPKKNKQHKFIAVKVKQAEIKSEKLTCTLELPQGYKITLPMEGMKEMLNLLGVTYA